MTLSSWIAELLLISLTGAHGLHRFPENFVIAKRNDRNPVTLTCRTASSEPVTWKMDGEEVGFDDYLEKDGKNLIVQEIEEPFLGEYTCWTGEEKLSSTYLLQEAEVDEEIECRAKSYDCNFTCSWNHRGFKALRYGLGQECTKGQESCNWVSSSNRHQFVLSHALSPYAEERTMLEVTVEATDNLHFFRRTKSFYLRDIIVPDSPHIVRCQKVDQKLNVTVGPPSSWSTPHSFFSLEHEIQYVFRDDGMIQSSLSTLIPREISKLRVRSRDSLTLSEWSHPSLSAFALYMLSCVLTCLQCSLVCRIYDFFMTSPVCLFTYLWFRKGSVSI
uniref:Interleukin-12 subunit beta n=1 Tax=Kryptolebias marmoratus TaxID=37003 RepID=A0A3Q2ZR21_KRYMA